MKTKIPVEIRKPPGRHAFSDQLFIHDHGLENVAAAHLLVFGRRAIHEYASARGQDLELLIPLLQEMAGAWLDTRDGCSGQVATVAQKLGDRMLPVDYPSVARHTKKAARERRAQAWN